MRVKRWHGDYLEPRREVVECFYDLTSGIPHTEVAAINSCTFIIRKVVLTA